VPQEEANDDHGGQGHVQGQATDLPVRFRHPGHLSS
jgi:hypothetical protein